MILNETVAAIADAIREKTGKSELIKPVDFATEIKGISAGGGESGGSDWHYFDTSALDLTDTVTDVQVNPLLMMVRFELMGKVTIGSAGYYDFANAFAGGNTKILAFGLDFTQLTIQDGISVSFKELIDEVKNNGVSLTEITKEQFYDLNA